MELITSTANPRVKDAATLQRRRVRRERAQHLVEGPHALEAALAGGHVTQLFATEEFNLDELGDGAHKAASLVQRVAPHVLEKLADTAAPQGVIGVANTPPQANLSQFTTGILVVLDNNDPGNVGAIIRSADASGAAGVILTRDSADPYSPKAIRSAAGSTYHLPLATDVAVETLVEHAAKNGWHLASFDAAGTTDVLQFNPPAGVTCLCFGHETTGVDPLLQAAATTTVTITMFGQAESLNVAAAAAIATYNVCARYHTA